MGDYIDNLMHDFSKWVQSLAMNVIQSCTKPLTHDQIHSGILSKHQAVQWVTLSEFKARWHSPLCLNWYNTGPKSVSILWHHHEWSVWWGIIPSVGIEPWHWKQMYVSHQQMEKMCRIHSNCEGISIRYILLYSVCVSSFMNVSGVFLSISRR